MTQLHPELWQRQTKVKIGCTPTINRLHSENVCHQFFRAKKAEKCRPQRLLAIFLRATFIIVKLRSSTKSTENAMDATASFNQVAAFGLNTKGGNATENAMEFDATGDAASPNNFTPSTSSEQ